MYATRTYFCTISSGLRVQFRYLLANLRKIYIHDVNVDASQADRALNWTARITKIYHQLVGYLGHRRPNSVCSFI